MKAWVTQWDSTEWEGRLEERGKPGEVDGVDIQGAEPVMRFCLGPVQGLISFVVSQGAWKLQEAKGSKS